MAWMSNTETGDNEGNTGLDLDIHIEHQTNLLRCFYFEGSSVNPLTRDFTYRDDQPECTGSVLASAGTITSNTMPNVTIDVAQFYPNAVVPLFDTPSLYTLNGTIKLPLTSWAEPAAFSGEFCDYLYSSSQGPQCTKYVPTAPININPDFVLDQPYAHTGTRPVAGGIITDGWYARVAGSTSNHLTYTDNITGGPVATPYYEGIVVNSTYTPGTSESIGLRTFVEGPEITTLRWSGSAANPIFLDFWAMASTVGEYDVSLQNSANNMSFVQPFTISTASTWQHFKFQIPGPTTGTFVADAKPHRVLSVLFSRSWVNVSDNDAAHVAVRALLYDGDGKQSRGHGRRKHAVSCGCARYSQWV